VAFDCTDGIRNDSETDVDCGGPNCSACGPGGECLLPGDCDSGVCLGGICFPPVCGDGVTNGTDVCDDAGNSPTCDSDCTLPLCSDNFVNPAAGETCDDGNLIAGDGCSITCQLENLFTNGSFETGDYTGWTLLENSGIPLNGTFGVLTSPTTVNPDTTQVYDWYDGQLNVCSSPGLPYTFVATDGAFVGVHLQQGPEQHRMYQDVTLPIGTGRIRWDMYYNNTWGSWDPAGQYIAVNLRDTTTDAIIATVFKTTAGDPLVLAGMTPYSVDLSPWAGTTVRIDFEMMVNLNWMDVGYDNFRVTP